MKWTTRGTLQYKKRCWVGAYARSFKANRAWPCVMGRVRSTSWGGWVITGVRRQHSDVIEVEAHVIINTTNVSEED